jgi:hypothetical protein
MASLDSIICRRSSTTGAPRVPAGSSPARKFLVGARGLALEHVLTRPASNLLAT